MKNLVLLFAFAMMMSCSSNSNDCKEVEYNTTFNIDYNEEVCLADGNSIHFVKLNDSLCPCGENCADEGYMAFGLSVSLEGNVYEGEVSLYNNVLLPNQTAWTDLDLPDNYKLELIDQFPGVTTIPCGGDTKAESVTLTISLGRK